MSAPRLFISYSWSSQEHETWVIDLATQLRGSGVDVVLDKWELKEGHDSIPFMEKMVTDESIKKVAIISDKKYAEKADGRTSGVGTETQIISQGIYEKQDQTKFVAVLPERDPEGKPYLPTYYKSRIYIDLSSADSYGTEFERLVRWVFDKPLHVKPELGSPPAFLQEEPAHSLSTGIAFRRGIDALKNGRPYVEGAVDDYLTTFASNLERFRITLNNQSPSDEQVAASIEEFAPHKNEYVQMLLAVAQYAPNGDMQKKVHRFFEQLIPYLNAPANLGSYTTHSFDNFRFSVHELFLHTIAILVRYERFAFINRLLSTPFYIGDNGRGGNSVASFTALRDYMESFQGRSQRLGRLSSRADLLKQRAEVAGFDFKSIMQADFLLWLKATLVDDHYVRWGPDTLLYATNSWGPMEIFARSQSVEYFSSSVSKILGGITPDAFKAHIAKLQADRGELPNWQFERISPTVLTGIDKLGTTP